MTKNIPSPAAKLRPVLMHGGSVNGILAGRKIQTCHPLKPQPRPIPDGPVQQGVIYTSGWFESLDPPEYVYDRCPYGQPGDYLWVRETWCELDRAHWHRPHAARDTLFTISGIPRRNAIAYRADTSLDGESIRAQYGYGWKQSTFMPRWASRLLLRIDQIDIKRLSGLGDQSALDEGIVESSAFPGKYTYPGLSAKTVPIVQPAPAEAFLCAWEKIYGRSSLESDPWVWVIRFTWTDRTITHDREPDSIYAAWHNIIP